MHWIFVAPFTVCKIQIARRSWTRALAELLCIQKCHLILFNRSCEAACDSMSPWRRCRSASEPLVCSSPCSCVPKQPDCIVVCEGSGKFKFCTDIYHLLPLIFVTHGWLCTLKSAVLPIIRQKIQWLINQLESLWMCSWGKNIWPSDSNSLPSIEASISHFHVDARRATQTKIIYGSEKGLIFSPFNNVAP